MYDKLTCDFKKELIDRKLDILINISFSALLIVYLVSSFILWIFFKHWVVLFGSSLVLYLLAIIIAYTIIFIIAKKKKSFRAKDYFHLKRVLNSLKDISKKDVQILVPLLKRYGINTRPKVQEADKHYQILLLRKSKNGFAILSIISLAISIASIILSALNYKSGKDLIVLLIVLLSLIICVTLVCILIKIIYRTICYNLSEYALYERIEAALSEIWMKQLI